MSIRAVVAAASVLVAGTAAAQTPQGTTFTYQGRLADAGAPADGPFDFQFILYDAAVGGSQVGPIVLRDDVVVTNGLFTVSLDFGASFAGSKRWLDVSVRPGATAGTYTPIVPRQELAAAPSALFSAAAPWTGVSSKPAGFADDVDNDVLGGLTCGGGQVAKWNGSTWACAADAVNPGTVTSVGAGAGLTGGPVTSAGTLSVSFGGGGAATSVARSDHNHHGQTWTATNPTGLTVESTSNAGTGVYGLSLSTTGVTTGVWGESSSTSGRAVYGRAIGGAGSTFGVYGSTQSSAGIGVRGEATSSGGGAVGVQGLTSASSGGRGVWGVALGTAGTSYAVFGSAQSEVVSYAGYFQGRAHVTGTLSKGAGAFKIDHPLDPEHRYLYHSFVESPDMKNVYDGVVTTDADGLATVTMPEWFEALNRDFRYQLTVLGDGPWARARVFRKLADNAFVIQTDLPRVEVSWQLTGIRQDAYAEKHRIPVEEDKPDEERGTYLHPKSWGQRPERGLDHRRDAALP